MPSHTLAAAAFLVLAPSVALVAVPALRAAPDVAPPPRTPATSGTAPPARTSGVGRPPDPFPKSSKGERWIWPLSPRPAVLRGFTLGPERWSRGHRGVDLAAREGA